MPKYTCHYCDGQSSPKNLLEILTLPDRDSVIHVCALCKLAEYDVDRAAKQAVLTAEVMLAAAVGDERAVRARIGTRHVARTARLFLL